LKPVVGSEVAEENVGIVLANDAGLESAEEGRERVCLRRVEEVE